jgi:hypothetical protein
MRHRRATTGWNPPAFTEGTFMQDNIMQTAMQPYIKLVQSNMELLAKFSMSPEVVAQAAAGAQSLLQQGQDSGSNLLQSGSNLMQSRAFAQLVQGMLKNYTEFLTDVGQTGMTLLAQGQAAMTRQIQEASEQVMDAATQTGKRAARKTA